MAQTITPIGARNGVELEVAPTAEALGEMAAERIRDAAVARIAEAGRFTLALSGGSTPRLYHEVLATRYRDAIEWAKVTVLFSDDRCVPPTHKDSNYRLAEETLLSRVPIPPGNVHRIECEDGNNVHAAREYAQVLSRVVGPESIVDVCTLGLGEDGHTASLFPSSDGASKPQNGVPGAAESLVVATEAPPTSPIAKRVSFSYGMIAKSRIVLIAVNGAAKAARLRQVLRDEGNLPMQRVLRERLGRTVLVADQAAASQLGELGRKA